MDDQNNRSRHSKGCRRKKKVLFHINAYLIAISFVKRDFRSRLGPSAHVDRQGIYSTSDLSATSIIKAYSSRLVRALIDTVAAKSVVGLRTAKRIARASGESLEPSPSSWRFRFGVDAHSSMGRCHNRIPTRKESQISRYML